MQEQIDKTRRQNHYKGGQVHHGFNRVLRKGFALSDGRGYCKQCEWEWFAHTGDVINRTTHKIIHKNGNKLDDRIDNLRKVTWDEAKKIRYKQTSETLKGHKLSRQTKMKISEGLKGNVLSQEARDKISKKLKGFKHSETAKENMSKAQQRLILTGKKKRLFGKNNPSWKGGLIFNKHTGYYYVHNPGFSTADSKGYIKRANYIWYQKTKEIIKPPYILHHINGDKTDDRFENSGNSKILSNIKLQNDWTDEQLAKEIENRKLVLNWMRKNNIKNYTDVGRIISDYTKYPEELLVKVRREMKK